MGLSVSLLNCRSLSLLVPLAFTVLVGLLLVACSNGASGLSRADVQEIVRAEIADAPAPPQPEPGLTSADVEEAIRKAMADLPQPAPGLTRNEVEEIVQAAIASVPSKSAPADYTRFFVESAIARYETQGLEATLAHYNREQSVDGQWYVFIIDENDMVIGHPDTSRLGLDVKGWVGTDANGYNFGPDMLSATEEGKWVSYVFKNPESGGVGSGNLGDLELKNVWVVRHDGLLFASGWYIDADEFTRQLVSAAVDKFRSGGLAATVEYFANPGSVLAGLEAAIAYYNTAETVDGKSRAGRVYCGRKREHRGALEPRFGREADGGGSWSWVGGLFYFAGGPLGCLRVVADVDSGVRRILVRLRLAPRQIGRLSSCSG